MKRITYEQFIECKPCFLKYPTLKALMESIAKRQIWWSALDILELNEIDIPDRLWAVFMSGLVDETTMRKFAIRCAERALKNTDRPDPRCRIAITTARAWIKGEADGKLLNRANANAMSAASDISTYYAWPSVWASYIPSGNQTDARLFLLAAQDEATSAMRDKTPTNPDMEAYERELKWQLEELKSMLRRHG